MTTAETQALLNLKEKLHKRLLDESEKEYTCNNDFDLLWDDIERYLTDTLTMLYSE